MSEGKPLIYNAHLTSAYYWLDEAVINIGKSIGDLELALRHLEESQDIAKDYAASVKEYFNRAKELRVDIASTMKNLRRLISGVSGEGE
jgi:hypothetical protein